MSNQIEETLKALTEFEQELDRVKADASEAKRQLTKKSSELSESAKQKAIEQAKKIASEEVARARAEAEVQAAKIRSDGQVALKSFEGSLSGNMEDAVEIVIRSLLGEPR